ncbi:S1 family peptidase [Cystobacter fuscus]|uniref:S1 family peptidase n=1 Tax=Cystobacter fuscus TaxID=43 RepID=UPI0037BEF141
MASLGACAPVSSDVDGPPASRGDAVVGGTEAPGDGAVVALVARRVRCAGESLTLLCSGALIAPDVVLTAAHCLDVFGPEGAYEVFFGARLLPETRTEGRFVRVARAVRHPDYERETHAHDVALLRLAVAVEVAPLRLAGPGEDVLMPDGAARVVGFGDTRDGAPPGVRRQGGLRVTQVRPDVFLAGPDPAMSCVGDSGGPVLVRDAEGGEVLAGVTVSGDFACQKEAVNLRVDAVRDSFLQPFLDERPEPPGPGLALDALCTRTCTRDADCPAGLACAETADASRRCFLPALQPGDYGASCAEDAQCGAGGVCARLEPEGDDMCRCFTPCAEPVSGPPSEPTSGEELPPGCTGAPGPGALALGALATWLYLRRGLLPRARRATGRCRASSCAG